MISIKELRIGNAVRKGDEVGTVKMIAEKGFQVDKEDGHTLGNSLWVNFEPILITEELLIKVGFEKGEDSGIGEIDYSLEEINVWYDECDFMLKLIWDNYEIPFDIELKSFHHLQNIVFDLTGKELTI